MLAQHDTHAIKAAQLSFVKHLNETSPVSSKVPASTPDDTALDFRKSEDANKPEPEHIKMVAQLYSKGGMVISVADVNASGKTYQRETTTTSEFLASAFVDIGMEKEAKALLKHPWPKDAPTEIVFQVPGTQETMTRLGFTEQLGVRV